MRITYLNVSAQMGGAETSLLELLSSIKAAHSDWHLTIILAAHGPLVSKVEALGMQIRVLPFPPEVSSLGDSDPTSAHTTKLLTTFKALNKTRSYSAHLAASLRDIQPDIIHSTGFKMHLLSVWARPTGTPVIWHMHDYVSSRPLMRKLLKSHESKCASIIANSHSVRQDVLNALHPRAEVRTIYNSIDLARFSPQGPTINLDVAAGLPPAPEGTVKIGLLATFAKWKGHALFLKALTLLPKHTPFRAYVIGGAIYQTSGSQHSLSELQAEMQRLGLSGRVGFTGFLYPPDAAIRSLDVVVHASTQPEPFGMVIAEAMACGKPVVFSNASGASEILSGHDALPYNCGNAEDLAEKLSLLLANPESRAQMGENARRSVQKVMAGSRLASDLVHAYKTVLSPDSIGSLAVV